MTLPDTRWMADGLCRQVGGELWYGTEDESPVAARKRIAAAKAVCANCPVRDLCEAYALRMGERFGVWGGKSADELRERTALDWRDWRDSLTEEQCSHYNTAYRRGDPGLENEQGHREYKRRNRDRTATRRLRGPAEFVEEYLLLRDRGLSNREIAVEMQLLPDSLAQNLRRHRDVLESALARRETAA